VQTGVPIPNLLFLWRPGTVSYSVTFDHISSDKWHLIQSNGFSMCTSVTDDAHTYRWTVNAVVTCRNRRNCFQQCRILINDDKLQCIQNRAARIVCGIGRRQQSARQLRHSLHWLPIRARTDFKLAILSWKSRMTGQADYLAAELRSYQPQLSLRSSSQELSTVPHCKTMLGRRHFSVAAPRVWNSLPLGLKTNCDSLRRL